MPPRPEAEQRLLTGDAEQGPARRQRRAPDIPGSSPPGRAGPYAGAAAAQGQETRPSDPSRHSPTEGTTNQLPPEVKTPNLPRLFKYPLASPAPRRAPPRAGQSAGKERPGGGA